MKIKHFPDNWKWIQTNYFFMAWDPIEELNDLLDLLLQICERLGEYESSDEKLEVES